MDLIDLGKFEDRESGFTGVLNDLCARLDLQHATYCAVNTLTSRVEGFATYDERWKRHYGEQKLQLIDPTITMSAMSIAPVDWSRFERNASFSAVFDTGRDFGIPSQGITVPIRGPFGECGMLSVSRDCSDREWSSLKGHILSDLQMSAVTMHDAVMRSDSLGAVLHRPNLSHREREVLQWTAAGKSQSDIGDILSISYRTVEVHLRSARTKLAAVTTPQAVGRGIALGLIHPK